MHEDFYYATDTELDNADADQIGSFYPERAWVVTDRDVIHANRYYKGPPIPHPDDDESWERIAEHPEGSEAGLKAWQEAEAERRAAAALKPPEPFWDDDIPF